MFADHVEMGYSDETTASRGKNVPLSRLIALPYNSSAGRTPIVLCTVELNILATKGRRIDQSVLVPVLNTKALMYLRASLFALSTIAFSSLEYARVN